MKVKFFIEKDAKKLEDMVNDWIEENIKEILDIKVLSQNKNNIGVLVVYDESLIGKIWEGDIASELLN